jgi:hypothetical protein
MREAFIDKDLRQVGGSQYFVWNWLSSSGHSGGILLGVKHDLMEVGAFQEGEYFTSALVRSKKDDFKWEVVVVYGPAHHDKSEAFLELSNKCQRTRVPIVIGGDFNLIRCAEDKNNDHKLESSEDVQLFYC